MNTPKRKKRGDVPALNPLELQAALGQLQALPIDKQSKQQLEEIMRAASSPGAHSPEVLIAGLEQERQETIRETAKQINRQFAALFKRGKQALMDMSAAEWERLVKDANEE